MVHNDILFYLFVSSHDCTVLLILSNDNLQNGLQVMTLTYSIGNLDIR